MNLSFTLSALAPFAVALTCAGAATPVNAGTVFINELHYDNTGADEQEFVELAGPADTDVTGWSLVLYNGGNGKPYRTVNLTGVIDNEVDDFGALGVSVPGIQNGAPDGIALIDSAGAVVDFISYEGNFDAVAGPATGNVSKDINVAETGTDPAGLSLQLVGLGNESSAFTWGGPSPSSFGDLNLGQTLAPVPLPSGIWLLTGAIGATLYRHRATKVLAS
ncbi:MAG: hypothetical protein ACI8PT_002283 [Gammaproteobacteria bacterium]|jgi:hypothetical protein